jgi:hypothetical protein
MAVTFDERFVEGPSKSPQGGPVRSTNERSLSRQMTHLSGASMRRGCLGEEIAAPRIAAWQWKRQNRQQRSSEAETLRILGQALVAEGRDAERLIR